MKTSSYEDLSGSQLVTVYNAMAEQLGIPTVKRFSDAKAGVRRCEELRAKLSAAGKDPARPEPETREEQPNEPEVRMGVKVEPPTPETVDAVTPLPEVQPIIEAAPEPPAKKGKKKEEPKTGELTLLDRFGARSGTIQEKILRVLCEHLNSNVPLPDLVEAGYGDKGAAAGAAAIGMVMKGVKKTITVRNLNLELRRTQNGKTKYIGLYEIDAGAVAA